MATVTLNDYHMKVADSILRNKDWRVGQSMFNVLYDIRPDLSEQIRATDLDPFHVEDKVFNSSDTVGKFLDWIDEHWSDSVPEGFKKPTAREILQRTIDKAMST